jgi:hypothetical protein
VMFRAVLCLVPGLFYVKYLEIKNVPRFHVLSRHTRVRDPLASHFSCVNCQDMEHVEHVEQRLFSII